MGVIDFVECIFIYIAQGSVCEYVTNEHRWVYEQWYRGHGRET